MLLCPDSTSDQRCVYGAYYHTNDYYSIPLIHQLGDFAYSYILISLQRGLSSFCLFVVCHTRVADTCGVQ